MERNTVCIDVETYRHLMFTHKAMTDKLKLVLIDNYLYTDQYNQLTEGKTVYIYSDDQIVHDLGKTIEKRDEVIRRLEEANKRMGEIKAMSVKEFKEFRKENV